MWSTCLLFMISPFFMVLIAYFTLLLVFTQPTRTFPKAPKSVVNNNGNSEDEQMKRWYLPSPKELPKTMSDS